MAPSLIKSISHFLTVDYSQIFIETDYNDILCFFTKPVVPFLLVLCYLSGSKPFFNFIRESFNLKPKGGVIDVFTVIHSGKIYYYTHCYYPIIIIIYSIFSFIFWMDMLL